MCWRRDLALVYGYDGAAVHCKHLKQARPQSNTR
jgi:hypothetical protein